MKAFRNLVSGEDDELTTAYAQFHKTIEQEAGAVRNVTLAAVEELKQKTSDMHADVMVGLATTKRTDENTKTLMASTGRMQQYLEGKNPFRPFLLLASKETTRSRNCYRT